MLTARAKQALYLAARRIGLFGLARGATRRQLRILAYHGFASGDETRFRGKLFISPDTFRRRLDALMAGRYPVVDLGEALEQLQHGTLPDCAVAITIDDGWASTLRIAAPALREHGYPATVYLTTYYMGRQAPVFDLFVGYLIWKASCDSATVEHLPQTETIRLDLSSAQARAAATSRLIEIGRGLDGDDQRQRLCLALARSLGVDPGPVIESGSLRLMSFDEARQAMAMGMTVGLHTHRHRFPPGDQATCLAEIEDNRRALLAELGVEATHFCYPSGVHDRAHWSLLAKAGVRSATTCDLGLVRKGDNPMSLSRFLDGESVTDIEFEAEISGFAQLLRAGLGVQRKGGDG